jgi:hypothetical protein
MLGALGGMSPRVCRTQSCQATGGEQLPTEGPLGAGSSRGGTSQRANGLWRRRPLARCVELACAPKEEQQRPAHLQASVSGAR